MFVPCARYRLFVFREPHFESIEPGAKLTQAHGSCLFSTAVNLTSSSATSIVRTWVEISPMISVASCGDSSPAAQAEITADDALRASAAVSILDNSNSTARSRRG